MADGRILTTAELASIRREYRGASLLPARTYHDPAIFDWERREVLRRDWVMVGREEDVAEPGTYRLVELDGEPLIVVRGRDAVLRAFHNVCRHRGHGRGRGGMRQGRPLPVPVSRLDLRPRRLAHPGQAHRRPRGLQLRDVRAGVRPARDVAGLRLPEPRSRRRAAAPTSWATSSDALGRFDFGDAPLGQADRVRGRRELEVHRRELQRVLPLPGPPPAAQQADAVRPRRRLRPGRRRGRVAGWSSPTAPRRWPSTAATGRATGARRCAGITAEDERRVYYYVLWPTTFLSIHPDYLLVHRLVPQAVRTGRSSPATGCSRPRRSPGPTSTRPTRSPSGT